MCLIIGSHACPRPLVCWPGGRLTGWGRLEAAAAQGGRRAGAHGVCRRRRCLLACHLPSPTPRCPLRASTCPPPGGRRPGSQPHPEHRPHDQAALSAKPGAQPACPPAPGACCRHSWQGHASVVGRVARPPHALGTFPLHAASFHTSPPHPTLPPAAPLKPTPTLPARPCTTTVCGGVAEGGHVQQRKRHLPHQVCGRGVDGECAVWGRRRRGGAGPVRSCRGSRAVQVPMLVGRGAARAAPLAAGGMRRRRGRCGKARQ